MKENAGSTRHFLYHSFRRYFSATETILENPITKGNDIRINIRLIIHSTCAGKQKNVQRQYFFEKT